MKIILLFCLLVSFCFATGGYNNLVIKEFMNSNADIYALMTETLDKEAGAEYQLWKIENISYQLVQGMNFKMIANYQRKVDPNQYIQFEIIVFDQPQTNTRKVASLKSAHLKIGDKQNQSKYNQWVDVDVKKFFDKNPSIQTLLLSKIIPKYELDLETSIIEVMSIKEQFISGKTYLIFVKLSDGKQYKGTLYKNPWSQKMEVVTVEPEDYL